MQGFARPYSRYGLMFMEHKEPAFGFWIPVTDRASAQYAAKMSGLPVFLLGLSFLSIGLVQIVSTGVSKFQLIGGIIALCGGFLVFSGLRIRALRFRTLPFTVGLWLVLNIVSIYISGFGLGTILPLLIGLMAACGLRGWWWLRKAETA